MQVSISTHRSRKQPVLHSMLEFPKWKRSRSDTGLGQYALSHVRTISGLHSSIVAGSRVVLHLHLQGCKLSKISHMQYTTR